MVRTVELLAIVFTAITMAAGWAHLLELPNKMKLSPEDYLIVPQIYQGWALLGIAVVGALVSTLMLAFVKRGDYPAFFLAMAAAVCIALILERR